MTRHSRARSLEPEELTARLITFRQSYYISRVDGCGASLIDDEAILEIEAVVEAISNRHRKHVGQTMRISLLNANRYTGNEADRTAFFGSVAFRGDQRSALAYLPAEPFARLPFLLERNAKALQVQFSPLRHGYGELLNLFVGDDIDLAELAELTGNSVPGLP
jgi:hypothetical protein